MIRFAAGNGRKRFAILLLAVGCGSGSSKGCSCNSSDRPAPPDTSSHSAHNCSAPPTCASGTHLDLGFCVPDCDATGTENCPCHSDGTCTPVDNTPLTCLSNVCQKSTPPAVGSLGATCSPTQACDPSLRCVSGQCQKPDCPSGQLGCPCGPYGSCAPYAGQATRCAADHLCAIPECVVAEGARKPAGAACATPDECVDGLTCRNSKCLLPEATLKIASAEARACDVVLEGAKGSRPQAPRFAASVRGESHSRSPHLALSFVSATRTSFGGAVARLEYLGTQPPAVVKQTCFDEAGNPIQDPLVSLE